MEPVVSPKTMSEATVELEEPDSTRGLELERSLIQPLLAVTEATEVHPVLKTTVAMEEAPEVPEVPVSKDRKQETAMSVSKDPTSSEATEATEAIPCLDPVVLVGTEEFPQEVT